MLRNYRAIKEFNAQSNANDQIYSKLFSHPISILVVSLVEKTFITPNMLTFVSLLCSISAAYFIAFLEGPQSLIIAWLGLHFALVFDSADGQLARWKKIGSPLGAYLDVLTDQLQHRLVLIALAYRLSGEMEHIFLITLIVLSIESLAWHENVLQKNIKLQNKNNTIQSDRDTVAAKVFGGRKVHRFLARLQTLIFSDYIYNAVFLILDMPFYLILAKGLVSFTWLVKRFVLFFSSARVSKK